MARIKIVEVISFSNEDPKHSAENLLKHDSYQKWKCIAGNEEKQVYVILKLECLSRISSIDIGNESSAFVEVLAAREGIEYKVLLSASSFMSPLEARNNTQTNRVRLFPFEKLTKSTAEEKWDRIKIICTQPFNKSLQYGLSFINLHSNKKVQSAKESRHSIGSFILNDPDSDEDDIKVGTFFKNFKAGSFAKKLDGTKKGMDGENSTLIKKKENVSIATDVGFYQPKKEEKLIKRTLEEDADSSRNLQRTPVTKKQKNAVTEIKVDTSKEINKPQGIKLDKSKEMNKPKEIKLEATDDGAKRSHRPFHQLLNDVVFVMSGYQNPLRSNLRDKMTQLGARYKSDWDQTCTHLLCAFRNTPKYRAIKGKAIIVSEKWAEDCYKQKKRISCTRYFLEKSKTPVVEEEEIWADEIMPKNTDNSPVKKDKEDIIEESNDLSDYEADTEEENTDDELRRVIEKQHESKNMVNPDAVYDEDTDIDEENQIKDTSHMELPELPDYFKSKIFFLYGSFSDEKEQLIKRYIIGFNGKIEGYMTEEVDYVITESEWDEHFEDALCDNPTLQFVRPQWIWRCSERQKFVPPQPYVIVPKEVE